MKNKREYFLLILILFLWKFNILILILIKDLGYQVNFYLHVTIGMFNVTLTIQFHNSSDCCSFLV